MYEFTSRYEVLGVEPPNPATMCQGQCEGLGVYPHRTGVEDETPYERETWLTAHNAPDAHKDDNGECDGYHFIKCPDCGGSGKRQ